MAMFRAGVAPINIELMRYGPSQRPVEQRKCFICTNEIESECHVLTQCPLYGDIRESLFYKLASHVTHFNDMTDQKKMCVILGNNEFTRINAKTCYEILECRKNAIYVCLFLL